MPARHGTGQMNQGYDNEDSTNLIKEKEAFVVLCSEQMGL